MPTRRRHLVLRAVRGAPRAACGLADPPHYTSDPAEVTCKGCRRTLAMADAEIAQRNRRK